MDGPFAFIGAALSVMFLVMIAMIIWHCGFNSTCYSLVMSGL